MNNETNLRQAESVVTVEGILSEKDLKEYVQDGKKSIRGKVVLQTSETNFVTINVFVNEKTKNGNDNNAYAGVQTVMNTYNSIADVGVDMADVVRVNRGQLAPRSWGDEGGIRESVQLQNSYFRRVARSESEFVAELSAEIFIEQIRTEVYTSGENQGNPTGRKIIKGWMPMYNNGIEPVEFVAPVEDGIADALEYEFEVGQTVRVSADIINTKIENVLTIPVKIGRPKKEIQSKYVNEFVIFGISEPYEDDKKYNKDAIKAAINERQSRLESEVQAAKNKTNVTQPVAQSTATAAGRNLNW